MAKRQSVLQDELVNFAAATSQLLQDDAEVWVRRKISLA